MSLESSIIDFDEIKDHAFHLVLVRPQIPQNTGSIARLCASFDTVLHIVKPIGFELKDKYLKRAGLDYWKSVRMCVHESWDQYFERMSSLKHILFTTHAKKFVFEYDLKPPVVLVFGSETAGLKTDIDLKATDLALALIPIEKEVRSINLAQSAAIGLYEAKRQAQEFDGAAIG